MFTPLAEADTSQIGGMVGERGDSDMEPGRGSLSCGLPPCFSSFLNFDLLFWNQIFTCSIHRGKGWGVGELGVPQGKRKALSGWGVGSVGELLKFCRMCCWVISRTIYLDILQRTRRKLAPPPPHCHYPIHSRCCPSPQNNEPRCIFCPVFFIIIIF